MELENVKSAEYFITKVKHYQSHTGQSYLKPGYWIDRPFFNFSFVIIIRKKF